MARFPALLPALRSSLFRDAALARARRDLSAAAEADVLPLILGHMEALGFGAADPQALANATWALARLRRRPDAAWAGGALRALRARARGMGDGRHLSVALWAVATLGLRPPPAWVTYFFTQVRPLAGDRGRAGAVGTVGIAVRRTLRGGVAWTSRAATLKRRNTLLRAGVWLRRVCSIARGAPVLLDASALQR